MRYETRRESIELGDVTVELEALADIDKTIDDLFAIYQAEGRTDLFEEMCPYFGTLWPAGRILALHMAERELPKEKRILELGCGLALPSLYLAKKGIAASATDIHPDVPIFLERNRTLNGLMEPRFLPLDWRLDDLRAKSGGGWDLILASDVLYDKTQPATLLRFLKRAVVPGGRVLLADPGRTYVQGFFDDAVQQGFKVKTEGLFGVLIGELTHDVVS